MNNLLSLFLGLLAWGFGTAAILKKGRWQTSASLTACCLSLFFQLKEVQVQVLEQDWSALLDTWDTVVLCAGVLVTVTVVLNAIACSRIK